jgi:hypothetical protein
LTRLCKIFAQSPDGKKAVCIDVENEGEIMGYVLQTPRYRDKFMHIVQLILGGHRITDLYDKEDIDAKSKHVTAMKFFKGQENGRIYCKEMRTTDGVFVVVTAEVYPRKKSEGVSKKEIPIIHKVASYEYKIQTPADQP